MANDSQQDPQPPAPPAPPAKPSGPTHYLAKANLDVVRETKGKKAVVTFEPGIVPAAKLSPEEIASFSAQGVLEPVAFSTESASQ